MFTVNSSNNKILKNVVLAGLFIALGLVMPFLTMQIPAVGSRLLPMHLPVLLAGFICGWPFGLAVGFIVPLLRSLLLTMPPMFPTAIAMAFELATYGFLTGLFYQLLPKRKINIYLNLFLAIIGGRIVWGIVSLFLYGLADLPFGWEIFMAAAFLNALPGIVLQFMLIPYLIIKLKKAELIKDGFIQWS